MPMIGIPNYSHLLLVFHIILLLLFLFLFLLVISELGFWTLFVECGIPAGEANVVGVDCDDNCSFCGLDENVLAFVLSFIITIWGVRITSSDVDFFATLIEPNYENDVPQKNKGEGDDYQNAGGDESASSTIRLLNPKRDEEHQGYDQGNE